MEEQKSYGSVRVDDSLAIKAIRSIQKFGLNCEGLQYRNNLNGLTAFKLISQTKTKTRFFGLFKRIFTDSKKVSLFRAEHPNGKNIEFLVWGRENLPLAKTIAEQIAEVSKESILVTLVHENGEKVENDQDDFTWLRTRRELLEKEQRRIESELADVYKKLNALAAGAGPFRGLNAAE